MSACKKMMIEIEKSRVAIVAIDRPKAANAFSKDVMSELTQIFLDLAEDTQVRCVILKGEGKHFSAGADLNWMKDSAKLNYQQNISDSEMLNKMFRAYTDLPMPTIAAVRGAAYGGAVGLIAASDIVVADENAKFCLSEARLGLLPAVIYPLLMRKIATGPIKRWALTARVLDVHEAQRIHLVDVVAANLEQGVKEELQLILNGAPIAQSRIKSLHETVRSSDQFIDKTCIQAIAEARTSEEGQHGLQSFFDKKTPEWSHQVGEQLAGQI